MTAKTAAALDLAQFEGHTPGPWRCVDRSEVFWTPSSASPIPFAIEYEHPTVSAVLPIADVCNFPPASPEQTAYQRANGRLLAAGPALLAECKRQREELTETEEVSNNNYALLTAERLEAAKLRADIAKLREALRDSVGELKGCGMGAYCQTEADARIIAAAEAALKDSANG